MRTAHSVAMAVGLLLAVMPGPAEGRSGKAAQVRSPSGNIRCALGPTVECLVAEAAYPPLRPERCGNGAWVPTYFAVSDSGVTRGACVSDPVITMQDPPVLDYGTTVVLPAGACSSAESGMTCWDLETGHGFRLSRKTYEVF